jgi:hypothetical protein
MFHCPLWICAPEIRSGGRIHCGHCFKLELFRGRVHTSRGTACNISAHRSESIAKLGNSTLYPNFWTYTFLLSCYGFLEIIVLLVNMHTYTKTIVYIYRDLNDEGA